MRKDVVAEFVTPDGVMEAPDQRSSPFWNDEAAEFKSDALPLGRVTYQGRRRTSGSASSVVK